MAAIILVTMVTLLPCSVALTESELSRFTARTHTEKNSNTQGTVTVTTEGTNHRLVSNGIPDHNTGTFPGRGNPNNIQTQSYDVTFPAFPSVATQPTCLPKGPIAFTINGIPLFNPFNAFGENAVEGETAEVFDLCDGHPDMRGVYHYHQAPKCVYNGGNDEFIGVALDGFPIYGTKDASGNELTSAELDECHGEVYDGTKYRYRLTADFPYIMACFKGTPQGISRRRLRDPDCKVITGTKIIHESSTTTTPSVGRTSTETSLGHRTMPVVLIISIALGFQYQIMMI